MHSPFARRRGRHEDLRLGGVQMRSTSGLRFVFTLGRPTKQPRYGYNIMANETGPNTSAPNGNGQIGEGALKQVGWTANNFPQFWLKCRPNSVK